MKRFFRDVSLQILLGLALMSSMAAGDALSEYFLDLKTVIQESKVVSFFDAEKKAVITISGKESDSINDHYEKLFKDRKTSCIILIREKNIFSRKTFFIWGDKTRIFTHDGRLINASILDLIEKIKRFDRISPK